MSIIFEGVDGTGKTTNALGYLSISPDYSYVHNWAKPKKPMDIASEITKEFLLLTSHWPILFDRSFIISEYVYAHILERKTEVNNRVLIDFVHRINEGNHTVKLFTFDEVSDLKFKKEDRNLPFRELNDAYMSLLVDQYKIKNLIIENVSNRENKLKEIIIDEVNRSVI